MSLRVAVNFNPLRCRIVSNSAAADTFERHAGRFLVLFHFCENVGVVLKLLFAAHTKCRLNLRLLHSEHSLVPDLFVELMHFGPAVDKK